MKRLIKVFAIVSAFSLCAVFAGCSKATDPTSSGEPSAQPAATQAVGDTTEAQVEETTAPIEETTALPTDPEAYLTMYDEGSYFNSSLYKDCEYQMPLIKLDSADAKSANSELEEIYRQCQEDIKLAESPEYIDGVQTVSYTAALNGPVLSLCVERVYHMSVRKYNVVNIDVLTGEGLDNSAVLSAAGTSEEQIKDQTKTAVDAFYSDRYSANIGSKSYHKTMSDENIAAARYYLGADNSVYAAFDVFFEAGVGITEGTAQITG